MSWNQLPPVGTKALPWSQDYAPSPLSFAGFDYKLVNSGTAALGAILRWDVAQRGNERPYKVAIPGYACPDLVAACVYAGAVPVIIDLAETRYDYASEQLTAIADSISAIICPALFGISMPIAELRATLGDDVLIIEDNAQWFPETAINRQRASLKNYPLPTDTHQADFFITSFGRGKPVNLLGGGLLAWNTTRVPSFTLTLEAVNENPGKLKMQARAFNLLCHPFFYGALSRVPGLHLGATHYHALDSVTALSSAKQHSLPAAVLAYLRGHRATQQTLQDALPLLWAEQACDKRLLRFPLLTQSGHSRDALLHKLNHAGLGASPMYAKPLRDIDGVDKLVEAPYATPVCQQLADCMLTLPLHKGVKPKHVQRMIHIIDEQRQWLSNKPAA